MILGVSCDKTLSIVTDSLYTTTACGKKELSDMVFVRGNTVEFVFYRPGARDVYLAGDFNEWCIGSTPMTPQGDGHWSSRLQLQPGEFRFRYYADGEWFTDYAACGLEPGQFGLDSILILPARDVILPHPPANHTNSHAVSA